MLSLRMIVLFECAFRERRMFGKFDILTFSFKSFQSLVSQAKVLREGLIKVSSNASEALEASALQSQPT